jgi:hypothetical protein
MSIYTRRKHQVKRSRVTIEMLLSIATGILGLVTIAWHDWIEALTGWDPDHHNGTFEWLIVAGLLAVSIALGIIARRDWRRLQSIVG